MLFLTLGNADIQFDEKKLTWTTYTIKKTLPITYQIKIIDQKEFAKAALDENIEAFVMHVISLGSKISIYPSKKAQLVLLLSEEVTVPVEYSDFADVFLKKSTNILLERTGRNKHVIALEKGK